jgi:hypothetical protein
MQHQFVRAMLVCFTIALALGCKPSASEREESLSVFLRSLAQGTAEWEKFVPADSRAKALAARPVITADYTIIGWDHASVCCSFREDMYEYQLRFSNGKEAVSYVHVDEGRVDRISIELY